MIYCENEDAMAYADSLDPNLVPEEGSGSYATFDLYDKYSETDEWYYSAYMGFSGESTVKLMYECNSLYGSSASHCNLQITFENGVAVRIWVSYAYDDFDSSTSYGDIISEDENR